MGKRLAICRSLELARAAFAAAIAEKPALPVLDPQPHTGGVRSIQHAIN
jgi:hypothetical protein